MHISISFPQKVKLLLFVLALLLCTSVSAQVRVAEEIMVLPTYPVDPPNKTPIFFTSASSQGAAKYIYPLMLNDQISAVRKDVEYKALVLENEFIKVCLTPEMGGKLYYAIDKTNDFDFIYKNDVVRPGNISPIGAWVSGGIEWCVLHHHRPSTFLNVDYSITESESGKKTAWVGETEPRHRMRWSVGVSVVPGRSYFEAEVRVVNTTPHTHTFLYWANVAFHASENFQVFFPPSVQFATFHSKNVFTRFPFSTEFYNGSDFTAGVDVSLWKNSPNSNSFFAHDLKEDFMGGYDHGIEGGMVHIGDHNVVKGAKLWEWGSGPRGQATEARLTDNSGPYVELMVGAYSDNQPDYSWIRPGEVKVWKHYWYPIRDIDGFKNANLNGAVNLVMKDNNELFLGYYSTQKVPRARILLKNKDKILIQKDVEISPEKSFTQTLKNKEAVVYTDLYTELVNLENNEVLISYKPVELEKKDLPETVRSPRRPENIENLEELYLQGKRIEQFYNPRFNAMDYYTEALKRDPNDIRTNTAVGNFYLKNGDYRKARTYFTRAIKRLTKDYTRPSTCEALYQQGLVLKGLGLYDEAIDTLYRATWDYAYYSASFFELAQISAMRGDINKALDQINESISTNTKNPRAVAFKASLQRKLGDLKGAEATLGNFPTADPLDFRIANENYLVAKESGNNQKADQLLQSLNKKMRDNNSNYLELAVGYINDGLTDEAENVLRRFTGKDPEVNYFLGYLSDIKGNTSEAKKFFQAGYEMPVDYCMPFRLEALKAFGSALKYNPADGKAYYYMGNILYDKQPEKGIECWENSIKHNPEIALAHRNLGWASQKHDRDIKKAISYYEKAISLEKTEPMYYTELDELYELSNAPIEKRIKLFEGNSETVRKRDDSFVREVTVLTLAGQPDKAVEYLAGKTFSFREGNSRVREVIIDAQLSLGNKYFSQKDYKKALEHYLLAQIPDEEAGSARSGNRDIQVNYFIGLAYDALKNKARARTYFKNAAEQSTRSSGYMKYYQGMSRLKLGEKAKAEEIFRSMISDGETQLKQAGSSDFFVMFGEREAESTGRSRAFTMRGLGYKGLGQFDLAGEDLKKAVELSVDNLWARAELNSIPPAVK